MCFRTAWRAPCTTILPNLQTSWRSGRAIPWQCWSRILAASRAGGCAHCGGDRSGVCYCPSAAPSPPCALLSPYAGYFPPLSLILFPLLYLSPPSSSFWCLLSVQWLGYGLDDRGFETGQGQETLLFSRLATPALGPNQLRYRYFPVTKRPGMMLTADVHKAEIKNWWSCTSPPPLCLHNVDGNKFTFWVLSLSCFHLLVLCYVILFSLILYSFPLVSRPFFAFSFSSVWSPCSSFPSSQPSVKLSGTGNLPSDIIPPYTSSFRKNERNTFKVCFWNLDNVGKWIALVFRPVSEPYRITEIWNCYMKYLKHDAEVDRAPFTLL